MHITAHQLVQSAIQFLTVLVSELTALALVTGGPPDTAGEIYIPVLIAFGAALTILGGSQVRLPDAAGH